MLFKCMKSIAAVILCLVVSPPTKANEFGWQNSGPASDGSCTISKTAQDGALFVVSMGHGYQLTLLLSRDFPPGSILNNVMAPASKITISVDSKFPFILSGGLYLEVPENDFGFSSKALMIQIQSPVDKEFIEQFRAGSEMSITYSGKSTINLSGSESALNQLISCARLA